MADIKNIKIGSTDPEAIMFDRYHENVSNLKFDFTNWTINEDAGNDLIIEKNKVTIRKFKPNVWIMKAPPVTGIANTAICTACKDIIISSQNINKYSNVFANAQDFKNSAGAGNDLPKFRGFCPYPLSTNNIPIQAEDTYTWEMCWSGPDIRDLPQLADWAKFRIGSGNHGTYGIWADFTNKTLFPNELYDFPTIWRNSNPGVNQVTMAYGFLLCTGMVNDFDDGTWSTSNTAIREGKVIKVTNRLDSNSGWHVGKWAAPKACKIKVTGLSVGDSVHYCANTHTNKDVTICMEDGTYNIPAQSNGGSWGFGFYVAGTGTSEVTLEFVNDLTDENGLIDCSEYPIILELFNTNGIDLTSVECWDAYLGEEHIYHRDKTFENCLIKYGIALPNGFAITNISLSSNANIRKDGVLRFIINKNTTGNIEISTPNVGGNTDTLNINLREFKIRLLNLPEGAAATFRIPVTNSINSEDTYSKELANGDNIIEAYNKTITRKDSSNQLSYKAGEFIFTGLNGNDKEVIVEIIPIYNDDTIFNINTSNLDSIVQSHYIPEVVDLEEFIPRTKFNMVAQNSGIWDIIKKWYSTNTYSSLFYNGSIFRNSNLDEITIRIPNHEYEFGEDNFMNSDIKTINFVQTGESSYFSSPQRLLRSATKLETINIEWFNPENPTYLCGANSVADAFSSLSIKTYPERFINWGIKSNEDYYGISCTLFRYVFNQSSKLEHIPAFPDTEESVITIEDTMENSFNNCSSLITIDPTLNMILVQPKKSNNAFYGCALLTSVKIKNLNHGDWSFDNTIRDGIRNGNLPSLNEESIKYLFENLMDLNTHDPKKCIDSVETTFREWDSNYKKDSTDYYVGFSRALCYKRYSSIDSAPFILHTTEALNNVEIEVTGLQEGDSVVFVENNNTLPIQTWDTNCIKSISKSTGTDAGFKLIGNTELDSEVTISIVNHLDCTNPLVSTANLYCPEQWRDKVTSEMIASANAKGWSIYIGGSLAT